ncbi:MAG: D-alanyl-D-alanine carboxypeptidase/D-alanyl-D-alanine-endopeptidase [Prevotellaceae bacterium]|nr:D-alanyl-D-alanine carboxypeptidase/D-alanyl-D-alanine-endopeptidase [Prevotella sp.]MDD7256945.1 D-alanyl-D-alanine carboxypeptidase/D-alanyl-D-alanine-endopeptidase [Prevotellaceae bacterium]MDY6131384.1 D-alanyl-D-alanine carboxypeptidase/D-alanyl-D-alanine-endopeptidase [Prevotella sp.]
MTRLYLFLCVFFAATTVAAQEDIDDDDRLLREEDTTAVDTLELYVQDVDSRLAWPHNIRERIGRLLKSSVFTTSTVGICIYDLTADSAIYRYNDRQLMRPASTMKIVNAVAALDKLGGSYLFKTQLLYSGRIDSGVLQGNVYCKGGMDPLFNGDDMKAFVESLKKMGIDTIRGNVLADLTMKDRDLWGEGWCWDDDNPVLSPLLINRKDAFLQRFSQELKHVGIVLDGDTLKGATPAHAYEICVRTHTMDQVLMRMMKNSDNLFAEAMFYQLAASTGNFSAKARDARKLVNRLVTKFGLQPKDYYIADGSGLSLYNYVSPELEVQFLRYAYRNNNIFVHLLPSLPIAGVDGTLRKRMGKGTAQGNVKAKTGTVTGISSLAGYCTAANGHLLCFSIIHMGVRRSGIGRSFQDKVCEALCEP